MPPGDQSKLQKVTFQMPQTLPNVYHQQQQQQDQIDSNIQTATNSNSSNPTPNNNNIDKTFLLTHQVNNLNNSEIPFSANLLDNNQGAFQPNGLNPMGANQHYMLNHHQHHVQQQLSQQQQINNLNEKYILIENHLNGERHGNIIPTSFSNANSINPIIFDELFLK